MMFILIDTAKLKVAHHYIRSIKGTHVHLPVKDTTKEPLPIHEQPHGNVQKKHGHSIIEQT